jgi:hypothetical protein
VAEGLARLRDLLVGATRPLGVGDPGATGEVWARWRTWVGATVADHAEPTSLRSGVLKVRTESPAWATEIAYLASEIKSRVNDGVGHELVREVRVWTGPGTLAAEPAPAPVPESSRGMAAGAVASAPTEPTEALERAHRAWKARRQPRRQIGKKPW